MIQRSQLKTDTVHFWFRYRLAHSSSKLNLLISFAEYLYLFYTVDCSPYICYEEGVCYGGNAIAYHQVNDAEECLSFCQSNVDCAWFNFNPEDNDICILTTTCPYNVTDCVDSGCVYGQRECELGFWYGLNIMVATGYYQGELDDTEVIDTVAISQCSNLPQPYPVEVELAVAIEHESKIVICGGSPVTTDCYSYSNNRWDIEAFQLEPARYGAMSVEIRPGEWLIMGGTDGSNYFVDTKILSNGIFINGPNLPEPIEGGSSVMLNETHLFVASGRYQVSSPYYSPRNFILDIDSEEWTQIEDRTLDASYLHSSGTFFNFSANEIQIANVGHNGTEVYSPRENSWFEIPFPYPLTQLYQSAAIQQGPESFILIGGITNRESYSGDIYLFDDEGLSVVKENVLRVPRYDHVAVPVPKNEFTCG